MYVVVDSVSDDITDTYSSGYDIETDTTFMFVFASGEKFGGVQFTVTVGSKGGETDKLDIGTIAITDEDGALSLTLTSGNITAASTDSTVPAISSIATTSDRTASLSATGGTITIDTKSADVTISSVDVYFTSDSGSTYSDVTVTTASNTRTFELGTTSGLYRVRFTVKDTDETIWYFTAGITYTYSSSSVDPEELDPDDVATLESNAADDFNAATKSTVTGFSTLSDTQKTALASYVSAYSSLGVTSLEELLAYKDTATGKPRFAVMQLGKAVTTSDTIVVRFIVSTGVGVAPVSGATAYVGTFVPIAASDAIIIDCKGLYEADDNTTLLVFPSGIYAILAGIYNSGSGGSINAAAVSIDGQTALDAAEYSGNPATVTGGSNKGSSSGCDAGFGALALLAIVPFIKKIRK